MAAFRAEKHNKAVASLAGADKLCRPARIWWNNSALGSDGLQHLVKVAFGANIESDTDVLPHNRSIATYATNMPMPATPVWQLAFVSAPDSTS